VLRFVADAALRGSAVGKIEGSKQNLMSTSALDLYPACGSFIDRHDF
jgi:hypothetical protein